MEARIKEKIQGDLIQRKQELIEIVLREVEEVESELRTGGSEDAQIDYNHPADMVAPDPDYEKDITLVQRHRAELAMVDQALERIQRDDFDKCEECGEEIGEQRLLALPYTRTCVACQELDEHMQKLYGRESVTRH